MELILRQFPCPWNHSLDDELWHWLLLAAVRPSLLRESCIASRRRKVYTRLPSFRRALSSCRRDERRFGSVHAQNLHGMNRRSPTRRPVTGEEGRHHEDE